MRRPHTHAPPLPRILSRHTRQTQSSENPAFLLAVSEWHQIGGGNAARAAAAVTATTAAGGLTEDYSNGGCRRSHRFGGPFHAPPPLTEDCALVHRKRVAAAEIIDQFCLSSSSMEICVPAKLRVRFAAAAKALAAATAATAPFSSASSAPLVPQCSDALSSPPATPTASSSTSTASAAAATAAAAAAAMVLSNMDTEVAALLDAQSRLARTAVVKDLQPRYLKSKLYARYAKQHVSRRRLSTGVAAPMRPLPVPDAFADEALLRSLTTFGKAQQKAENRRESGGERNRGGPTGQDEAPAEPGNAGNTDNVARNKGPGGGVALTCAECHICVRQCLTVDMVLGSLDIYTLFLRYVCTRRVNMIFSAATHMD